MTGSVANVEETNGGGGDGTIVSNNEGGAVPFDVECLFFRWNLFSVAAGREGIRGVGFGGMSGSGGGGGGALGDVSCGAPGGAVGVGAALPFFTSLLDDFSALDAFSIGYS